MAKRILLVENEETLRLLLTDLLEIILGLDVMAATDGIEAIRTAHEYKPDLILMDLDLPRLDGWETTRALKNTEEFHNTPIAAITAHTMVGDRERALASGCDDYFPKPLDIDALVDFIQTNLSSSAGGETDL